MRYYRKKGRWYRENNTILNIEETAYMLLNTIEKVEYILYIAIPDTDIRIWNTDNNPI